MTPRSHLIAVICALVAAPLPAAAHFELAPGTVLPVLPVPTVAEIEAALVDASVEFDVPLSLLQALAHTEGRWVHDPARTGWGGRRGLFQLSPARIDEAADLLGTVPSSVELYLAPHVRGLAALLDAERPADPLAPSRPGVWRDAIEYAMEWSPGIADQVIDHLLQVVDQGAIGRIGSGEPVVVLPMPVEPQYLTLFSSSVGRSQNGVDYGSALYNPTSCNYTTDSRGVGDINYIVIHTTQGSYSGAISWFHNCSAQVSAHYVIRASDGEITQVVDESDTGWHAGNWTYNQESVGIEHEGWVSDPAWVTSAMESASAALSANILADLNIPADRNHVIGHNEVPGATHTDPGVYWDWAGYMALVTGSTTVTNTELVGFVRHTELTCTTCGIAGATVDAGALGTATTDASGYYSFDNINAGTYTVCATAPGYAEGCDTKTVQAGITNWKSLVLSESTTPAGGVLRGYIRHTALDCVDCGIASASVDISGVGTFTADSAGHYLASDVPAGDYTVCATAAGYVEACETKTVAAGTDNWRSVVLAAVAGDDDDTSGDDDTSASDDDSVAGDDDSVADDDTAASDDDTAASGDDDDLGTGPAPTGTRQEVGTPTRRGCSADHNNTAGGGSTGFALAVLAFVSLRRRRAA